MHCLTQRHLHSAVGSPRPFSPAHAVAVAVALAAAASLLLFFSSSSTLFTFSSPPQGEAAAYSSIPRRPREEAGMAARSFVLWLHGLGDSGPANEPIKTYFTSPQFKNTRWSFPSAPSMPVSCNYGAIMPSWFDIQEIPVAAVRSVLGF